LGTSLVLVRTMKTSQYSYPLGLLEGSGQEERKSIFALQTEIFSAFTDRLVEKGFSWILPVTLSKSTDPLWPDPDASIEKRIQLEVYGENVKTMQSMIVHKRILVSLGPEKFFILSPNVRIEKRERAKTGRHLYEFTQLDIEIAHAKMQDVFRLFEELIKTSISRVREKRGKELQVLGRDLIAPDTPFRICERTSLEEEYGKNWVQTISEKSKSPVWVTDLPREFYDFQDEATGAWRNYDLILPEGYGEVISGAEREYDYGKIIRKLERDGLDTRDYESMLRLAKDGALKPSAGAGLGIERFLAYVCGVEHVADVQPFPRVPGVVPDL
jgi:asparaginyl-tRNA synthetase